MAQKVNPISLRLQQTNRDFDNCWYTDYFYRKLVSRDIYLQQYINSFLKLIKLPSARFSIHYSPKSIKLYSFLCYPKQSREMRSRMFGLSIKKRRKYKTKKTWSKFNHIGFEKPLLLSNKKQIQKSAFFENKNVTKRLQFLTNYRLWSKIYNPFENILKKKKFVFINNIITPFNSVSSNTVKPLSTNRVFFSNKKKPALVFNKIYHSVLLHVYKNNRISYSISKNKYGDFLLPYIYREFSQKKKPVLFLPFGWFKIKKTNFQPNSRNFETTNQKQKNFLAYSLKNFLTTFFFIKLLNTPSSSLSSKKQIQFIKNTNKEKNKKTKNLVNYTRQYKKNYLQFFLVFYLLYINSTKNNLLQNNKHHLQNIINQLSNFFLFQPLSIFHIILQKESPFNFLLQQYNPLFVTRDFLPPSMDRGSFSNTKKSPEFSNLKKSRNLGSINSINEQFCFFNSITTTRNTKKLHQFKYKNYLEHFLCSQFNINAEFLPFGISQDWQNAGFLADEIVYFLERRVTFRRLKNKIIKKIAENPSIRGVRICCSGRVGGKSKKAQRAKTECVKYGQTSRHTFSSRIDFAQRTARTSFGSVGIKVWICYN